ncbi:hypothetical protein ACDA63_06160 [Uliginosibacterium sp. sgz301328]|uniref:hypothetical protein n=1 Tax=Uliginosibacterium sp. sgz301328 TaxID=3243764 RepID=UPI00359E140A
MKTRLLREFAGRTVSASQATVRHGTSEGDREHVTGLLSGGLHGGATGQALAAQVLSGY